MKIQTQRLDLVPCTLENYSYFAAQYDMGPHINMHVAELEDKPELLGWGVWMVVRRATGQTIGDAGFKGMPNSDGVVEIGYGIAAEAQNQGFATEAAKGLINWAFRTGRVKRVIAECTHGNVASIKVLEKLGLHRTGSNDELLFWALGK
ncbi:MAG TPA: GNAT family N-acetyltransferase [Planococcus sp. (in: firmicutes)]|nr:GNAT family N-acetyltransferase [Planococcus sp. (in: firmicutes)]